MRFGIFTISFSLFPSFLSLSLSLCCSVCKVFSFSRVFIFKVTKSKLEGRNKKFKFFLLFEICFWWYFSLSNQREPASGEKNEKCDGLNAGNTSLNYGFGHSINYTKTFFLHPFSVVVMKAKVKVQARLSHFHDFHGENLSSNHNLLRNKNNYIKKIPPTHSSEFDLRSIINDFSHDSTRLTHGLCM